MTARSSIEESVDLGTMVGPSSCSSNLPGGENRPLLMRTASIGKGSVRGLVVLDDDDESTVGRVKNVDEIAKTKADYENHESKSNQEPVPEEGTNISPSIANSISQDIESHENNERHEKDHRMVEDRNENEEPRDSSKPLSKLTISNIETHSKMIQGMTRKENQSVREPNESVNAPFTGRGQNTQAGNGAPTKTRPSSEFIHPASGATEKKDFRIVGDQNHRTSEVSKGGDTIKSVESSWMMTNSQRSSVPTIHHHQGHRCRPQLFFTRPIFRKKQWLCSLREPALDDGSMEMVFFERYRVKKTRNPPQ